MIGYVTLGSNDIPRAAAFYDELLAVIGAKRFMEADTFVSWATSPNTPSLGIIKPFDGQPASVGNGNMVALFVPEAIRMTLAAGLLSSAALPLYQQLEAMRRPAWVSTQLSSLLLTGGLIAAVLATGADLWVRLIGPGLAADARHTAASSLLVLSGVVPLLLVHALAAAVGQAQQRFLVAGLGSFLYNLPAVLLLLLRRSATDERSLAWAFVVGAMLMLLSPLFWRH